MRSFDDSPQPVFIFKDVTRLDFNRVDFHVTNSLTSGKSRTQQLRRWRRPLTASVPKGKV
jgi:hypothetical protein